MKIVGKPQVNQTLFSLCLVLCCITANAATSYLSSPMNGAMNVAPGALTVTAKTISGAVSYKIDLSTDGTFATIFKTYFGPIPFHTFSDLAYGIKYYARVSIDGGSTYGMKTYFTTAQPILSSPIKGAVNISPASVEVTSKTVPGASIYTIDLSTSNTFSSIFRTHTGSNSCTFSGLGYGKKYYARVKTDLKKSDSITSYGYGPITYFTTASLVVTSPKAGAMGIGPKSVEIVSKTISGADSYTIELSLSNTFSTIFQSHTGSNSQVFTDLGYGKRYYTRVKTNIFQGDSAVSAYGAMTNFTTASPDVTSPANAATGISTFAVITSKTVPGASSYTIEVSTDKMFVNNVMSSTGTNSQPFSLAASKKYYVRVKTNLVRNDSTSFGYGKTSYFTTGVGLPTAPDTNPNAFSAKQSSGNHELSVYPNPSTNTFKVVVNSEQNENMVVNIYDSFGNQIHSSSQSTNSLIELGQDLKGGTYLIKVSTGSGTKSVRVIKE